jgi:hypothetical protein
LPLLPDLMPLLSPVSEPPSQRHYRAFNVKSTFPVVAPPIHVLEKLPVGQTALAALTHPSHRPLLTLIFASAVAAFKVNSAVPEEPVVEIGAPPHFVIAPAMPPQIPSSATF